MPKTWLDEKELLEVYDKALAVGLQDKREFLLHDLPMSLTDKLEQNGSNEELMLSDLKQMNQDPAGKDNLIPLEVWLDNAASHTADHRKIREYFSELADRVAESDHDDQEEVTPPVPEGLTRGGFSDRPRAAASMRGTRGLIGVPPSALESIRGVPPGVADLDLDTINERAIFTNDLLPIGFLSHAAQMGKSVCRLLITRFENGTKRLSITGRAKKYFGTGWLIGASHIITNHHVINGRDKDEDDAPEVDFKLQGETARVEFDFDTDDEVPEVVKVAEMAYANKDLDFAILTLTENSRRPALPLWSREIELPADEVIPVNIIQHPGGAPKQIGMRNNLVAKLTELDLAYFTDTKGGSSGSPVCTDGWQVMALHKAATRTLGAMEFQGKDTQWVNIGTRIDRIIKDLKENQADLWEAIDAR